MNNPNAYKGYLIVGGYPQYDIWEYDADGEPDNIVTEWERTQDPVFIQIWTWNKEDEYWSQDGDFDIEEFGSIDEAKAAIDKFTEAKA